MPGATTPTGAAAYEARIRELEARVQDLQKTVAILEGRLADAAKSAPGAGVGAPAQAAAELLPTDIAYRDVDLKVTPPEGGRATIEVNGTVVGTHSKYADVRLNDQLRPGHRNQVKVTFTAAAAGKAAGELQVVARVKPESGWTTIHSFSATEDQREDTFSVPFRSAP